MILRRLRSRWVALVALTAMAYSGLGLLRLGEAHARIESHSRSLAERARRSGLPADLLRDPRAYLRAEAERAAARRTDALARFPEAQTPAWLRAEVRRIEDLQALHTVAGLGRELREGRSTDRRMLSPSASTLLARAQRSSVRLGPKSRPALRSAERLRAPARRPRLEAPASWKALDRPASSRGLRPLDPRQGLRPWTRVLGLGLPGPLALLALSEPADADLQPTPDAASDDPRIIEKARSLGDDPIRIFSFVRSSVATELYSGGKKGAVGTFLSLAGNDVDQASLLVALLRAAGIPARYEIGTVLLTASQANSLAGAGELSVSASALSSAGIRTDFASLGEGRGMGLQVEHTWVRAWVPLAAYRGIARSGTSHGWAHLSPQLAPTTGDDPVDLRDAALFDEAAYLATRRIETPVQTLEATVRQAAEDRGIDCTTLEAAMPVRRPAGELTLLPAELPAVRVATLATVAELPAEERHAVRIEARTSQGALQLSYEAPMAELWGRSVAITYEPATAEDAQIIAEHGGLESTPAFLVRLRAVLLVDGAAVASGSAEAPGVEQRIRIDLHSPATGLTRLEHPMIAGGVYAFGLSAGAVPSAVIAERTARAAELSGDAREAELLHVAAISYLGAVDAGRRRAAGLLWHRTFTEVEETMAAVVPRVEKLGGVPLSVSRDFFVVDAAGLRYGDYSVDGDHHRSADLARLVGLEGSVQEHVVGERFRGPRQYSAARLVALARESAVPIETFDEATVDEALTRIDWPEELEERLRDFAHQGLTVEAPRQGYAEPVLGNLYGFFARDPRTGAGAYMVETEVGPVNGGFGDNGQSNPNDGECALCGESGEGASRVHFASGNLTDTVTDLVLPARGLPLVFSRTYNSRVEVAGPRAMGPGWSHAFEERLIAEPDGSLTWVDERGIGRPFAADGPDAWTPPPKHFQTIEQQADGYLMRYPDGLVHRFDPDGRLVSQEDLSGHLLELAYDGAGRLAAVTAAGGNSLLLDHDDAGHLIRVTDSAGREVGFAYDASGRLETETDVLGQSRSYAYDAAGRMADKTDMSGNASRIGYDDQGRVVRLEDPLGDVRTYAYDPTNRRTVYTDRLGNRMLVELSELGQPTRIVDAQGGLREMAYDAQGNKTSEQDSRGNLSTWTYDGQGNVLTAIDPLGATSTFAYGPYSRLTETTDALGHTTSSTYDLEGNLLSSTDALGNVTSYAYEDGLPTEITRPGGATTRMQYDPSGSVTAITDPEGGRTELGYDAAGQMTSLTDALGASRTMQLDEAGRLLSLTDPLGAATSFEYDPDGRRTSATDAAGGTTLFRYDALGRLTETEDALGHVSRTEYDAEGRATARIDARGARTEMRYDALGRLVETRDPLGASTTLRYCADLASEPCCVIDALGNVTTVEQDELGRTVATVDSLGRRSETAYDILGRRESTTDPAGRVTSFGYDEVGRLAAVTDAIGGVTQYGYDARGNRTSVTDANGQVTRFEYDLANRLVRETTPIGTVTEYGFDAAGNRITKLDGKGQATSYVYDAARRLQTTTYDDGTTAAFTYDTRGNRLTAENVDSRRESTYDALGRLETVLDVETGRTIRYAYDEVGNRASMTVEPDGLTTTYAWDARGGLTRLTDPEGGEYRFAYDAAGRRTLATYPNGMTLAQTYSAASEILAMVYTRPSGEVLESFRYAYDAAGNRTEKVFADGSAERYGYDDLSRLTSATYGTGRAVEYVYDPVGNRLEMTETPPVGAPICAGDADCDTVFDDFDNCPAYANPGQTDGDRATAEQVGAEAYWAFDETSGTLALDAADGHDGTLTNGAVRIAAGREGHALRFDGVNDGVTATVPMAGASEASLELWIRTDRSQSSYVLSVPRSSGGSNGFDLGFDPTHVRACLVGSGGTGCAYSVQPYPDGAWHHLAATYDGLDLRLYWDGEEAGVNSTPAGTLGSDHDEVNVGRFGTGGYYYAGEADEVAVYGRALTAEEIARHAAAGALSDGLGDACDPCPASNDPACAPVTCLDADGDGYGVVGASHCPGGDAPFDCDDADPAVHPGVVDGCSGVDDDCDGRVDEVCVGAPRTTSYSYNAFNQVRDATDPGGVTAFAWDDNGNQTTRTTPAESTEYTWDARDRLSEIALPDGTSASYGYDTRNLRVSMDDADGARRVLLDGLEEMSEVDEGTGELTARFDHDPTRIDALLAQDDAAGRVAMLTDALGSVYGLVDDASVVRARYGYDVYGARSTTLEEIGTGWSFDGRPIVGDADRYHRERYLDAESVGWLAPDPLLSWAESGNRYAFVDSRSTVATDPLGLYCFMSLQYGFTPNGTKFFPGIPDPTAPGVCIHQGEYLFNAYLDLHFDEWRVPPPPPGRWGPHINYKEHKWAGDNYNKTPLFNYHAGLFYRYADQNICFRHGATGTEVGSTMRDDFCVPYQAYAVAAVAALVFVAVVILREERQPLLLERLQGDFASSADDPMLYAWPMFSRAVWSVASQSFAECLEAADG